MRPHAEIGELSSEIALYQRPAYVLALILNCKRIKKHYGTLGDELGDDLRQRGYLEVFKGVNR